MIPTAQQRSAIYSALILESASLATGEPERRLSSDQPLGAGECLDPLCDMCSRHESILAKARGES